MRIDIAGFGRTDRTVAHEKLLSLCEQADRLGFSGIWFNEFHFQPVPQAYPSTLLLASAVLARTEKLRVGTSILVTPLYHPLPLAEMAAQLHWQSGGRFDLGIGRGTHPSTFDILGIDQQEIPKRFANSYELMQRAFYQQVIIPKGMPWAPTDVPVGPLVASGEIPIYLAGTSIETLTFGAANRLPLLLSLQPPEDLQLKRYNAIIKECGYPDMRQHFSLSRFVFIGNTRADAKKNLVKRFELLHQQRIESALRAGRDISCISKPDLEAFRRLQTITGNAEDCAEQITLLESSSGISSLRLVFNGNGAFSHNEALEEMIMFGEKALPLIDTELIKSIL